MSFVNKWEPEMNNADYRGTAYGMSECVCHVSHGTITGPSRLSSRTSNAYSRQLT